MLKLIPGLLRAAQPVPQALSVALLHTTGEVSLPAAAVAEAKSKPALFKVRQHTQLAQGRCGQATMVYISSTLVLMIWQFRTDSSDLHELVIQQLVVWQQPGLLRWQHF